MGVEYRWEEDKQQLTVQTEREKQALAEDDSITSGQKEVSNVKKNTKKAKNTDGKSTEKKKEGPPNKKKKNRCAACSKRVGLAGIACRCGGLFCGYHRYSDRHNCPFDYQTLGADEIRKNNPRVAGKKIDKV